MIYRREQGCLLRPGINYTNDKHIIELVFYIKYGSYHRIWAIRYGKRSGNAELHRDFWKEPKTRVVNVPVYTPGVHQLVVESSYLTGTTILQSGIDYDEINPRQIRLKGGFASRSGSCQVSRRLESGGWYVDHTEWPKL